MQGVLLFLILIIAIENLIIIFALMQPQKPKSIEYQEFKGREENPPPKKNLINKQYEHMQKRK